MSDRFGKPEPRSHESLRNLNPKKLKKMLEDLKRKEKVFLAELKEEEEEVEKEVEKAKTEVAKVKKNINQSKKTIIKQVSNLQQSLKNDIKVTQDATKYNENTGKEIRTEKYHYKGGKRKTKKARKTKKNYWFF